MTKNEKERAYAKAYFYIAYRIYKKDGSITSQCQKWLTKAAKAGSSLAAQVNEKGYFSPKNHAEWAKEYRKELGSCDEDIKKYISNALEKNEKSMESFKILMLGGKGTGKTSTIAMIVDEFDKKSFGNLNLLPSFSNGDTFGQKLAEMAELASKDEFLEKTRVPTSESVVHELSINLKSTPLNSGIKMSFIDIPGEWIKGGEFNENMEKELKSSNVFIVAIDAPLLMEENGAFNETVNYCSAVCNRIKQLDLSDAGVMASGKKMILFVPLKCEKYFAEGRMPEVNDKIKDRYKPTFNFLRGSIAHNCEVAIVPILTMGIFKFDGFKRDKNGEVKPFAKYAKFIEKTYK